MTTSEPSTAADKPLKVGSRMRRAWQDIAAHPWCSEAMIRINYGQQTINHLIKADMIEARAGRHDRELRARHEWHQLDQSNKQTILAASVQRVATSASVRSVPCPVCQAEPGHGCTSARSGRPCSLHPARHVIWIARVLARYGELEVKE